MRANWVLEVFGGLIVIMGVALLWGRGRLVARLDRTGWAQRSRESQIGMLRRWQSRPSRFWYVPVVLGVSIAISAFATGVDGAGGAVGFSAGLLIWYGLAHKPESRYVRWVEAMSADPERRSRFNRRFSLAVGGFNVLLGAGMMVAGFTVCPAAPC